MSRSYCPECGPQQTNHLLLWIDGAFGALPSPVSFHQVPFYGTFIRVMESIIFLLGSVLLSCGNILRITSLSEDIEKSSSNRTRLLWAEARRRGILMRQIIVLGHPTDSFLIQHRGRTHFFTSIPLDVDDAALRMDDKIFFKKAMSDAGLPVPRHYSASNLQDAEVALAELSLVCVKPRRGSNGRHTYPYVRTHDELERAMRSVKQICPFASVEEHLEGNLCRATCVDNTLIGFLESSHPHIVGDGVSTVRELIATANTERLSETEVLHIDPSVEEYIRRRGYGVDDILPEGEYLQLTYRGGRSVASSNREHGRGIHPSFIPIIEAAAKLTGLPVVGFDIIIQDPAKPENEQRWGFIEANSLPWIDLHANPYYGEKIDLAPHVWDLWERK